MIKAFERMVVELGWERGLAITALNMNPLCPSDHLANIIVDELIEAHKNICLSFVGSSHETAGEDIYVRNQTASRITDLCFLYLGNRTAYRKEDSTASAPAGIYL